MRRFRATMYYLGATAAAVDGNAALRIYIIEAVSENENYFIAEMRDKFSRSVDDEISFGPITDKGEAKQDGTTHLTGS
jgi:hypothetical protein